jgi:predicted regulator of Ras-like GTPase activity (Roadblock/LC7/MglB family)
MLTLPQLLEADVQHIDAALRDLLKLGEATTALLTDQAGFLITHQGDDQKFDLTTIAALASGAYMANQSIANLIHEENFSCTYQQGERHSLLVTAVDEQCLILVVFPAETGVGMVKYYAPGICRRIGAQLKIARQRDPSAGVDLATLNLADSESFFKRKA